MTIIYTITGPLKKISHGLVDFLAPGYIIRYGEKIPCEFGFTVFSDEKEATHIFIKDGITNAGTHYYSQTIEL